MSEVELARAMGANLAYRKDERDIVFHWPDGHSTRAFSPRTDANDDYAVLEWARENLTPKQFVKFSENIANLLIGLEKKKPFDALCISLTTKYQIGLYARAACKVLEIKTD